MKRSEWREKVYKVNYKNDAMGFSISAISNAVGPPNRIVKTENGINYYWDCKDGSIVVNKGNHGEDSMYNY